VRLALDTSAYSHFMRGDPAAVDLVDVADWVGVSVVVLGELRTGFGLGKRSKQNEAELEAFLQNPVVHVLDVDNEAARIYSEIVIALRRAGTPVPTNDIWIAATAARVGAQIVTYDAHFRAIGRVGSLVLDRK
jgi:tRNA(fMet)-specific endonuclease VapC